MTNLPDRWEIKRLDEIADIVMGQSPPGSSYNEHGEGQPFFQGKTEFGDVHPTVRKYTTAGTKFAKAGDILMSVRAPVGPTNIADIDCVIGRGLAAIRAKSVVSQSYLRWSLKHLEIDIQSKGTGTTFDAITGETLRGTLVALPPMAEQHKIVELLEDQLSRLDAALTDVKQAKIKAAQFRRSLLQFAFRRRLADQQEKSNWTTAQLSDLADIGWGDLQVTKKSYVDSGYVAYSATGADGFLPYFDYDSEGIIVSAIGANCGRIFKASGKWSCIKNTMRILPKNSSILIDYLFHYLSDSTIFPKRGSGQPFIGQQDAREIEISFPSVAEQQKIIESVEYSLSRLDASMNLAEQMENQSAGLRRSLLQAAFTGQLTNEVVSV